jgi:DNA invertase Pin-like site-specific DNA recombinase
MQAKTKCVAAYIRVSTIGQNAAGQRAEIENWLAGNGIRSASVRWFVDKGKSGDNLKRPAFDALQAAVFAGQVKTIVTYKLDRLSRSLRDGINVLCE